MRISIFEFMHPSFCLPSGFSPFYGRERRFTAQTICSRNGFGFGVLLSPLKLGKQRK